MEVNKFDSRLVHTLEQVAIQLSLVNDHLKRIADAVAPEEHAIVDSPYVAGKLGCTTTWVAAMALKGDIPRSCIVPGSGNGKLWKFYREKIDQWIASR